MHYTSRHVSEIILEVSTLIFATTSGRWLKKVFKNSRRKQEEQLDKYPCKPFRDPSMLASHKEQKI